MRRSAGAVAATRQQSYWCAYSDVRWESTSTIFNIISHVTLTPATEGVELFMRLGVCVSFWLPRDNHKKSRWVENPQPPQSSVLSRVSPPSFSPEVVSVQAREMHEPEEVSLADARRTQSFLRSPARGVRDDDFERMSAVRGCGAGEPMLADGISVGSGEEEAIPLAEPQLEVPRLRDTFSNDQRCIPRMDDVDGHSKTGSL